MVSIKYLYIALLAICAPVFLQGCASHHSGLKSPLISGERPELSGQVLWQQAMLASRKARIALLIQAASHFLASGKLVWAERALGELSNVSLTLNQQEQVVLLRAECLLRTQRYTDAKRLLPSWFEVSSGWSIDDRRHWCQIQCHIADGLGSLSQQILAWQRLADQYPPDSDKRRRALAALWGVVVSKPIAGLHQAREAVNSHSVQAAWLDLGLLMSKQSSREGRWASFQDWLLRYPEHPATLFMKEKQSKIAWPTLKKVALLLPLSGYFQAQGQAIRRGFYAAYYQHRKQHASSLPEVAIYNTALHPVLDLYQQAVTEGASLIVGPLLKPNVIALEHSGQLSRPTIALNATTKSAQRLYQFSLNPETAAHMIADRLAQEGRWHVAIFCQDAPWAKRMMLAFKKRWASYHGVVADTLLVTSSKPLSSSIRHFLSITDSAARARQLTHFLKKKKIRFVPSRRDDIDAIVLFSGQKQAKQIRPFLSYYFAGDLPVYAGPSVYDRSDKVSGNNNDLNGIQFLSTPWQVISQSGVPPMIAQERSALHSVASHAAAKKDARFLAMGADSFELMLRLPWLIAMPHLSFYGGTGILLLDEKQRIERRLVWARFSHGQVKSVDVH